MTPKKKRGKVSDIAIETYRIERDILYWASRTQIGRSDRGNESELRVILVIGTTSVLVL